MKNALELSYLALSINRFQTGLQSAVQTQLNPRSPSQQVSPPYPENSHPSPPTPSPSPRSRHSRRRSRSHADEDDNSVVLRHSNRFISTSHKPTITTTNSNIPTSGSRSISTSQQQQQRRRQRPQRRQHPKRDIVSPNHDQSNRLHLHTSLQSADEDGDPRVIIKTVNKELTQEGLINKYKLWSNHSLQQQTTAIRVMQRRMRKYSGPHLSEKQCRRKLATYLSRKRKREPHHSHTHLATSEAGRAGRGSPNTPAASASASYKYKCKPKSSSNFNSSSNCSVSNKSSSSYKPAKRVKR